MGTARRNGSGADLAQAEPPHLVAGARLLAAAPEALPPRTHAEPYRVSFTQRPDRSGFRLVLPLYLALALAYLVWLASNLDWGIWVGPVLFAAMLFSVLRASMFLWLTRTILDPVHRRTRLERSVDALITTSSEPIAIVEQTVRGALAVKGIGEVHVLDDGGREELVALTQRLGASYHARGSRLHAKAGNLNFGLRFTDAEFLLILDADHVPARDFLKRTLGYLDDESVAIVQTPQYYYNESFLHRRTRRGRWGEQDMFYKCIQPAKNRWNAAFFVGTSAILRRAAIDDVGGFSTATATEDIHTAVRMHARGWHSVFVSEVRASGLEVESLREFYQQRRRWAAGSMGLLLRSADSPLRIPGLTMSQRANYVDSMLGHQQGTLMLAWQLLPIVCSLTQIAPFTVASGELLAVTGTFIALTLLAVWVHARGTFHVLHTQASWIAVSFSNIAGLFGAFLPHERFRPARKNARRNERSFVRFALWGLVVLSVAALIRDLQVIVAGPPSSRSLALGCAVFVILSLVVLLDLVLPLRAYERRGVIAKPVYGRASAIHAIVAAVPDRPVHEAVPEAFEYAYAPASRGRPAGGMDGRLADAQVGRRRAADELA